MSVVRNGVAEQLIERSQETVARLRLDPYFGRLLAGEVDAEEYAAFLVQMHRWIRNAIRGLKGHADALVAQAARDPRRRSVAVGADHHVEEEVGHDTLILEDLAALWGCSRAEALGRAELEESTPSTIEWERTMDGMIARYPCAFAGIAVAMETLSANVTDEMVQNLRAQGRIPGIERALSFLEHHSSEVEDDHVGGAKLRAEAFTSARDRAAIYYYGAASLAMFEAMQRYLAERYPAPVAELVGA